MLTHTMNSIQAEVDNYVEQIINGEAASMSFEMCYRRIYGLTSQCTESEMRHLYHQWVARLLESGASNDVLCAFRDVFMYPVKKYHLGVVF